MTRPQHRHFLLARQTTTSLPLPASYLGRVGGGVGKPLFWAPRSHQWASDLDGLLWLSQCLGARKEERERG